MGIKKVIILILIITIILLLGVIVVGAFLFFSNGAGNAGGGNPFTPTWNDSTLGDIEINEGVVGYVLYQLGAYDLHSPIFSSNTPKIEVIVDGEKFDSIVDKGNILTKKGSVENPDIRIFATRRDMINIINSTMPANTIQNSITEGTMSFEQVASKTTLFSKGYLSLYNKFTGEEIDINAQ